MRVVLASASPRRRELLRSLFSDFEIVVADIDESLCEGVSPRDGVEILSVRKGRAVADKLSDPEAIIISSDTLVELDGAPLGKPLDEDGALRMLDSLSGRAHRVHTGVAVHFRGRVYSGVDTTAVFFRDIPREEAVEYVKGGEPMDKAGAYGIQGEGGKFVEHIEGDFDTVMGLSVKLVRRLIDEVTGA